MRRTGILLGLLLAISAAPAWAVGSLADISIYDRTSGRTLPVYHAEGQWYVAGSTGNEYEVHVRNNTGGDVLAVVSVDGVNVVSGETASTSQSGYVVGAWQSLRIQGWRKSMARVAAFYFTDHSDAYATRTGRPDDVGVIGVAMFKRKVEPPVEVEEPQVRDDAPYNERLRSQAPYDGPTRREAPRQAERAGAGASADSAPASAVPRAAEKSIGTGHGRNQTSQARYVSFERESNTPNQLTVLRYDTHTNLVARGVIPQPRREPNPFPAHFVPDPPGRW